MRGKKRNATGAEKGGGAAKISRRKLVLFVGLILHSTPREAVGIVKTILRGRGWL